MAVTTINGRVVSYGNCGTGAGGFKAGNTCAKGGGGGKFSSTKRDGNKTKDSLESAKKTHDSIVKEGESLAGNSHAFRRATYYHNNPVGWAEEKSGHDKIPAEYWERFDTSTEAVKNATEVHHATLREIGNHVELEDFSEEDLDTRILYGEMSVATGYDAVTDAAESSPHDRYLISGYGEAERVSFQDEQAVKDFINNGTRDYLTGPAGPERTFFRLGKPPESGRSRNHAAGTSEGGVSVYLTPVSGSMGINESRGWYYFKGRQVGTGSDDEPVVVITSPPKKYVRERRKK